MEQNGPESVDEIQNAMTGAVVLQEEDQLRARFYGLFARLLAAPMSAETIQFVRNLEGGEGEFGGALSTFAALAQRSTETAASEEFTLLFYGNGSGGELLPYASHYLTGFLYERPLADLRRTLSEIGIAPADGLTEPEDHIAFLCEVMYGLITGTWDASPDAACQRTFFETHIAPWAGRFFADLEKAESAALYMPLGTMGRLFMAIEAEAFAMAGD